MITRTIELPGAPTVISGIFSTNADVLTLLVLRQIEAAGPLTGLDAVNAVASTARLLGIAPAGYALLHELTEAGFLQASAGTPRTYRLTGVGEEEAERLAQQCWPRLYGEVVRLKSRLAPASPRAWPAVQFASEWTDDAID